MSWGVGGRDVAAEGDLVGGGSGVVEWLFAGGYWGGDTEGLAWSRGGDGAGRDEG